MPTTTYFNANGRIIGEQTTWSTRLDYARDALESVIGTFNQSKSATSSARYKPYRDILNSNGTQPNFGWNGTSGYLKSAGTAHSEYSVRARIYGSGAGGWCSLDRYWPGELAFVYVSARPTSLTDSKGMQGTTTNHPPAGGGGGDFGPLDDGRGIRMLNYPHKVGVRATLSLPNNIVIPNWSVDGKINDYANFYIGLGGSFPLEAGVSISGCSSACQWAAFINLAGQELVRAKIPSLCGQTTMMELTITKWTASLTLSNPAVEFVASGSFTPDYPKAIFAAHSNSKYNRVAFTNASWTSLEYQTVQGGEWKAGDNKISNTLFHRGHGWVPESPPPYIPFIDALRPAKAAGQGCSCQTPCPPGIKPTGPTT